MKLRQIIEEIEFEAGLDKRKKAGAFIYRTFLEILDSYTALNKYGELYVSEEALETTPGQSRFVFPIAAQHPDWGNLYFRPDGDADRQYRLSKLGLPRGKSTTTGTVRGFLPTQNLTGPELQFELFPFDSITASDEVVISYWSYPSSLLTDLTKEVKPNALVSTVKSETIARLQMVLGNKNAASMFTNARQMHGRHFGQTEIVDTNGR